VLPVGVYGAERWKQSFILPTRAPVQVRFGPPFCVRTTGQKRLPKQQLGTIADQMMGQLAALLPPQYRGVYADLSQFPPDDLEFDCPNPLP